MRVGIISGHFIEDFLEESEAITVNTRYGDVNLWYKKIENKAVFFLNRHGKDANIPPHMINYLANIEALSLSKVNCIISLATVGSLKNSIKPGDIVIPDDFIDFTRNRINTFYSNQRVHVDMSNPFCRGLSTSMMESCKKLGIKFHDSGTYLTTEGPRLETRSEISMFSKFADVVGMTLVPEVILAREKEICFSSICLVCNMGAGLQTSLSAQEIKRMVEEKKPILTKILLDVLKNLSEDAVRCLYPLDEAKL